jgi:protein involved in polysaccharide export with SLBB domain
MLERYEPSGRIVTTFNLSEIASNPSIDRRIEDKDTIFIPKFKNDVYVFGEVLSPGSIPYKENFSVYDFIDSSGSFARHADKKHLVVVSPDGQSSGVRSTLFNRNIEVLPGSVIYVPRKLGELNGLDFATGVAPVVSSLALTLASLNSLD